MIVILNKVKTNEQLFTVEASSQFKDNYIQIDGSYSNPVIDNSNDGLTVNNNDGLTVNNNANDDNPVEKIVKKVLNDLIPGLSGVADNIEGKFRDTDYYEKGIDRVNDRK